MGWAHLAPRLVVRARAAAPAPVPAPSTAARTASEEAATNAAAVPKRCIGSRDKEPFPSLLPYLGLGIAPRLNSLFVKYHYPGYYPLHALHQQRSHAASFILPRRGIASRQQSSGVHDKHKDDAVDEAWGPPGDEVLSVVQRVLEAAEDDSPHGENFWEYKRREASQCLQQLPLCALAVLMVGLARIGELTPPLATAAAQRVGDALRDLRLNEGASLVFEGDGESPPAHQRAQAALGFSCPATLLVALRDGGLLKHSSAGLAARALQHELLLCVQPQVCSLSFEQLRRVLLLLGATAESLGLDAAAARELFAFAKRHLRRIQKKRHIAGSADARDSLALLWSLANISVAVGLPPPSNTSDKRGSSSSISNSSNMEELKGLNNDRDIVLHLLKADINAALTSRLPCSPLDLALAFIGLGRLGQQRAAEYVLAAFAAAAAAASGDEICRLGRDMLLSGAVEKGLWDAFADAAAAALQQQQQQYVLKEQSCQHQLIAAEIVQWLRFCGRAP